MFFVQVCVNYQGTGLLVWLCWSVFSFCLFCINVDQRGALVSFHPHWSLPLIPSVKIQQNWLSPTVSWNKTSAPLLLFYLTAGRNVYTNKQGLKLTLSHQPNTLTSAPLACLAIQKPGTLLTSMGKQKKMHPCSPLELQGLDCRKSILS